VISTYRGIDAIVIEAARKRSLALWNELLVANLPRMTALGKTFWRRELLELGRLLPDRPVVPVLTPELPVVNGSFRQFGAHGWQEPDGVRMRARRTARSA
jgi:hypothetical protein